MNLDHIHAFVLDQPWAIQRSKLDAILAVIDRKEAGITLSPEAVAAVVANVREPQASSGMVAVIPVYGTIFPKANMVSQMSGGASVQRLTAMFRQAMGDPQVKAVVFDFDSPGGSVFGVQELADEIKASRGSKPIVAVANHLMASAAYWMAASADEVVAAPSAQVGSVGVFAVHEDRSKANEAAGVKRTIISYGEGKTYGNPDEPLSEEALARAQYNAKGYYDTMVSGISKGRGVTADRVRGDWKAFVYGSKDAKELGLVDRVATLDDTLVRLSSPAGRRASVAARLPTTLMTLMGKPVVPVEFSAEELEATDARLRAFDLLEPAATLPEGDEPEDPETLYGRDEIRRRRARMW